MQMKMNLGNVQTTFGILKIENLMILDDIIEMFLRTSKFNKKNGWEYFKTTVASCFNQDSSIGTTFR